MVRLILVDDNLLAKRALSRVDFPAETQPMMPTEIVFIWVCSGNIIYTQQRDNGSLKFYLTIRNIYLTIRNNKFDIFSWIYLHSLYQMSCWTAPNGMTKVKDTLSYPSSNLLLTTIHNKLYNTCRSGILNAFLQWKRWNLDYNVLPIETRVQINLGNTIDTKVWYWGNIVGYDGFYNVELDSIPGKTYGGVSRDRIKPQSQLHRSGRMIDWNDIEPSPTQRLRDKWGRHASASDFDY